MYVSLAAGFVWVLDVCKSGGWMYVSQGDGCM